MRKSIHPLASKTSLIGKLLCLLNLPPIHLGWFASFLDVSFPFVYRVCEPTKLSLEFVSFSYVNKKAWRETKGLSPNRGSPCHWRFERTFTTAEIVQRGSSLGKYLEGKAKTKLTTTFWSILSQNSFLLFLFPTLPFSCPEC